ncbi:metalloproteinase inhibitor 2-like [Mytilus edulis]|uniref:metalloproteinase inhibitor 2-like n=1 Tax=Mytilus edulis TaxID=6550 RepID=UPI0039EF29C8
MTSSVQTSCYCPDTQHPQDLFCSSDYVMYGKAIKEKLIPGLADEMFNDSWTREYTFKIIFKMKGVSQGIGQDVVITTPESVELCGVRFTIGQSYILVGAKNSNGTKWIYLCDFDTISHLSYLSSYQTFYLFTRGSYSYRYNCRRGCKIGPESKGCKYNSQHTDNVSDCLVKKALCQRKGGRCRWVNNDTC